jgi:LEA14-like dessication related protein
MELGERRKGKQNDGASIISHIIRCEHRRYKDVYRKLLKNGAECKIKVKGRVFKGIEQTKVKYSCSGASIETPL